MQQIAVKMNEWWDDVSLVPSLAEYAIAKHSTERLRYEEQLAKQDVVTASAASILDGVAATVQKFGECRWFVRTGEATLQVRCYMNNPVATWAEVLPLLEALEPWGFDTLAWRNEDIAETYTRVFNNSAVGGMLALSVYVNLPGDTDECRRVVKGFTEGYMSRPEPIYGFDCTPGSSQPVVQPTERKE